MITLSRIERASIVVASLTLVAKITGLVRDRLLAGSFGASAELDIYYSAFRVPDLIVNLFVLGAVSSAFIPVFIEHYARDRARALRLAQNCFNIAIVVVGVVVGVAWVWAQPLANLIAPGFDVVHVTRLAELLRIMLLSPIIFAGSIVLGSVLQARERFVPYALAPVFYNLGIIVGIVALVPLARSQGYDALWGLGLGVVLGAALHFTVQLPGARSEGFRMGTGFDTHDPAVRKIGRLMVPRSIGVGATAVESIVMNAFASLLGAGNIAVMNLASNLQFVPISVVGVAVATATFPRLSQHAAAGELDALYARLMRGLLRTGALVTLTALVVGVFREPIVRLIFHVGAFGGASITQTASVLGILMFGVIAQSLIPILSRGFFALQDTLTPVLVSLTAIAINVGLSAVAVFVIGGDLRWLAGAYAVASNVQFGVLFLVFRAKYR